MNGQFELTTQCVLPILPVTWNIVLKRWAVSDVMSGMWNFSLQKRGVASLADAAEHSHQQERNVDMIMPTSQYLAYARHTEDDLNTTTDKIMPITSKNHVLQVIFLYLYITTLYRLISPPVGSMSQVLLMFLARLWESSSVSAILTNWLTDF